MEQDLKEKKAQTAGLARLQKWCGLRDRTEREVQEKMREVLGKMATPPTAVQAETWTEGWMTALREDRYVDDARCAESYTRVHHAESQAGQSNCRVPGRGLIRNFLSQPGHSISTFKTLGVNVKTPVQPLHVRDIGLSSVPATRIILQ